jgi:ribonuclease Z
VRWLHPESQIRGWRTPFREAPPKGVRQGSHPPLLNIDDLLTVIKRRSFSKGVNYEQYYLKGKKSMSTSDKKRSKKITRRDALKYSGMALGGFAMSGAMSAFAGKKTQSPTIEGCDQETCLTGRCIYPPEYDDTQQYTYFKELPKWKPTQGNPDVGEPETYIPPEENEMRITFLGSNIPNQLRRAQQMMSIFVEVGPGPNNSKPDQFVFDCGSGVCANYNAMGVSLGRMDKIFLTHMHGDHMSDLVHIYCFGAVADRKSPLFIWGGGPSGVKSQRPPRRLYDDGIKAFCTNLREACRWHSESQSFISTSYESYEPPTRKSWGLPHDPKPVGDDPINDGYAMIPIELDWSKYGKVRGDNVAYYNPKTGVKITHFPVIHCRKGSVGYKLEWNGLSMIYTGDTKPEYHSIQQAAGVNVFIHEMNPPAEVWAFKNMGLREPPKPEWDSYNNFQKSVDFAKMVQNSSHSPQGAFGYLLSQISPPPQLTVATHFPVADDMVECAKNSIEAHNPGIVWGEDIICSFDLMVLKVFQKGYKKPKIEQYQAVVSDFTFQAIGKQYNDLNPPKYWKYAVDEDGNQQYDENGDPVIVGDPYAQIDTSMEIPACDKNNGECNYREDGY